MIAGINKWLRLSWLLLVGAVLCASDLLAQSEPPEEPDNSGNRRIERLGEVTADEWEMDLALPPAAAEVSSAPVQNTLPDEEQNRRLQQLLSRLAASPKDARINAQLNDLLTEVLDQANSLMDAGAYGESDRLLQLIQSINPALPGFSAAIQRLQSHGEVSELLEMAEGALQTGQVLEPENASAVYYFNQALARDPVNRSALEGLEKAQNALIERALESGRELDFDAAEGWLHDASSLAAEQQAVEAAREELGAFKSERATELREQAISAMDAGDFNMADFAIIDLIALGGQEAWVASLRARLEEARLYGGFEPGQVIADPLNRAGGTAPEIVIIEADSFLMGTREDSDDSYDHEKPLHRVTIRQGFGIGVTEVSVAQFRLFIEHTGYRTAAEISGSSSIYDEAAGRLSKRSGVTWEHDYKGKRADPDLPVLHINAYDAQAYVQWLALETGKSYRLPSEAEYEYVARAGRKGKYWWGENSPAEAVENLTGERDKSPGKRQWTTSFKKYGDGHWGPAAVGSIGEGDLLHPMGVQDIAGNVSEWMADCWHDNYIKAPTDGSAWVNPGCKRRVVRGGYWASAPEQSRAAYRFPVSADSHGPVIGFRIARDL